MYARSSWYLYVARFLAGLASGGAYVTIPMLVGEIAEDKYDRKSKHIQK